MGVGVRQGMPLSQMLANRVLSEFDSKIEKRGLKMVRYADDIAIFFETKQKAQEGHKIILRHFGRDQAHYPGTCCELQDPNYRPKQTH